MLLFSHKFSPKGVNITRCIDVDMRGNGTNNHRFHAMPNHAHAIRELLVKIVSQAASLMLCPLRYATALLSPQSAQQQRHLVLLPALLHQLDDPIVDVGRLGAFGHIDAQL